MGEVKKGNKSINLYNGKCHRYVYRPNALSNGKETRTGGRENRNNRNRNKQNGLYKTLSRLHRRKNDRRNKQPMKEEKVFGGETEEREEQVTSNARTQK